MAVYRKTFFTFCLKNTNRNFVIKILYTVWARRLRSSSLLWSAEWPNDPHSLNENRLALCVSSVCNYYYYSTVFGAPLHLPFISSSSIHSSRVGWRCSPFMPIHWLRTKKSSTPPPTVAYFFEPIRSRKYIVSGLSFLHPPEERSRKRRRRTSTGTTSFC